MAAVLPEKTNRSAWLTVLFGSLSGGGAEAVPIEPGAGCGAALLAGAAPTLASSANKTSARRRPPEEWARRFIDVSLPSAESARYRPLAMPENKAPRTASGIVAIERCVLYPS